MRRADEDSRSASPSRTPSRRPSRTARSMPMHHRTHASPASGSPCVRAETSTADRAIAWSSPRWARATGAVRIRLPLPRSWLGARRSLGRRDREVRSIDGPAEDSPHLDAESEGQGPMRTTQLIRSPKSGRSTPSASRFEPRLTWYWIRFVFVLLSTSARFMRTKKGRP